MKLSSTEIDLIKSNLSVVMTDIEHQLECIEGEMDYEEPETLRLSDMWDCNDLGNWDAMLNSLLRIKELFNKPTGGSMAKKVTTKKATSKKKVASKKATKKAAPKKASSKKVAKRKPVRVKNNNNNNS
jgi:hypothetical protein